MLFRCFASAANIFQHLISMQCDSISLARVERTLLLISLCAELWLACNKAGTVSPGTNLPVGMFWIEARLNVFSCHQSHRSTTYELNRLLNRCTDPHRPEHGSCCL